MKKQKIQVMILAILCLVCAGGYFWIRSQDFETQEEIPETVVTDFDTDEVTELTVTGDNELDFVRGEDGTWTEATLEGETIDQDSVNMLLSQISHITTRETVVESPQDLTQYGLEEPFRTIEVKFSDGTSVTILAGAESTLLSKYYIRIQDNPDVYLVSSYLVTDFDKTAEEFIEEEETTEEETTEEETTEEETTQEETETS